ncbi:hypothetical protein M8C21_032361, partial [Ambrosia artemisiifolia]
FQCELGGQRVLHCSFFPPSTTSTTHIPLSLSQHPRTLSANRNNYYWAQYSCGCTMVGESWFHGLWKPSRKHDHGL